MILKFTDLIENNNKDRLKFSLSIMLEIFLVLAYGVQGFVDDFIKNIRLKCNITFCTML